MPATNHTSPSAPVAIPVGQATNGSAEIPANEMSLTVPSGAMRASGVAGLSCANHTSPSGPSVATVGRAVGKMPL